MDKIRDTAFLRLPVWRLPDEVMGKNGTPKVLPQLGIKIRRF
jgi:hypothetical protein